MWGKNDTPAGVKHPLKDKKHLPEDKFHAPEDKYYHIIGHVTPSNGCHVGTVSISGCLPETFMARTSCAEAVLPPTKSLNTSPATGVTGKGDVICNLPFILSHLRTWNVTPRSVAVELPQKNPTAPFQKSVASVSEVVAILRSVEPGPTIRSGAFAPDVGSSFEG